MFFEVLPDSNNFLTNVGVCANASAPRAFVSAPVCADKYWDWGAAVGWVLKILRKNYADIIGILNILPFR